MPMTVIGVTMVVKVWERAIDVQFFPELNNGNHLYIPIRRSAVRFLRDAQ